MTSVYLYERKEGIPDSFLVNLFLTEEEEYGPLFQTVKSAAFKKNFKVVSIPSEADYMMLPHNYSALERKERAYLENAEEFASRQGLTTIIFAYGDSHSDIIFNNSIILRTARYRSTVKPNEIVIPPFVEDLGEAHGVTYISKKELPIVGFAGMTNLPTVREEIKYRIKVLLSIVGESIGRCRLYQRRGLYFRRKVLCILSASKTCELLTHMRKSFSAAQRTILGKPNVVRQEFVDLIKNSHLPLVVRGNGNYSLRFFEVLSLGRVPLFIDTDTPLPLENEIDYDSFMLRVDHKDIERLPEIIDEFWKKTSDSEFLEMQKKARSVFEKHLLAGIFYENLFTKLGKSGSEHNISGN